MALPAAAVDMPPKRKQPATSDSSAPVKRRTTRSGGASAAAAAAADPPTLVSVAPPADSDWATAMRPAREQGKFVDITLLAGLRKIPAHKVVLVSHSPYLDGLLTSGLAESKQGGDTLKIGDDGTDSCAVEAIVDCFYSGKLSLSRSTVSGVIRTANLLAVDTVEKAACDFFVESIEPSTACEALAFAAAHAACGEHARGLRDRCAGYVVEHFAECADHSFANLPQEVVAEVIGRDDLPVEEAAVLRAVRAWFDHDAAGRQGALESLLPLIRWPLLPVEVQLRLPQEPLLWRMMLQGEQSCALGMQLQMECSAQFAASDAAAACPRLKHRRASPTAVPRGILHDYTPSAAWETVYDEPYADSTRDRFDEIKRQCQGFRYVLVGGRVDGSAALELCAAAPAADVFQRTTEDEAHEANGAFWYCRAGCSMGFAPTPTVDLRSADLTEEQGNQRLSWHLNGSGGYRLGEHGGLNSSTNVRKIVMGLR